MLDTSIAKINEMISTEVVINFEPKIFKQIAEKKLYSIALIPDESLGSNSLKIIKNERHINIVSSRPK